MKKLAMILLPLAILGVVLANNFKSSGPIALKNPDIQTFQAASDKSIVTGIVTDENELPVQGVSVTVKGSNTGEVTDKNGFYQIKIEDGDKKLKFSAVGFITKEVSIPSNGKLNVQLQPQKMQDIEQVVVTAKAKSEYSVARPVIPPSASPRPNMSLLSPRNAPSHTDREGYSNISENAFHSVKTSPLSTFSVDVDGASYSNIRRYINEGRLPPDGAVRVEEMINYFTYNYPQPTGNDPIHIETELSDCPWNKDHKLALIALQGRKMETENLPASNLVFLVDVSGSMINENKLGYVKKSLAMLTDKLRPMDKISIVVYAGNAGLVLPATSGGNKSRIKAALNQLEAGGSTAGGEGIKLAYKVARQNFVKGGNNRVILCTDGDFNVGASSDDEMVRLIEKERTSGVFISVMGFGMGNYQDSKMQQIADKGNGNHYYIDNLNEARKVFVSEFGGTLFTIAKDVKLQIEFNPAMVSGYRLVGYENRLLNDEDFNDDTKDAGEMGSGHTVTALYEIIPAGVESSLLKNIDPLKYQTQPATISSDPDWFTVKFRYKQPAGDVSKMVSNAVRSAAKPITSSSENLRFASSVAMFGMLLRNSEFKGSSSFTEVSKLASGAIGADVQGYRSEFASMVKKAAALKNNNAGAGDDDLTGLSE